MPRGLDERYEASKDLVLKGLADPAQEREQVLLFGNRKGVENAPRDVPSGKPLFGRGAGVRRRYQLVVK